RGRGEPPQQEQQHRQPHELNPARDDEPRRPAEGAHAGDSSAAVARLRPPDWEWSFATEGSLALDLAHAWDEPRLKAVPEPATVPRMSRPVAPRRARVTRRQHLERERRRRRLALLVVAGLVAGVV